MSERENTAPGKIALVNAATNEVTGEIDFSEVPESIRRVPNARGEIEPVVMITELTLGRRRIIKQIGRVGTILKSTVALLGE